MDRFSERAIVLGTVDYADADRLVTLFTRGRGKLTAFAAGARKSRRRFAGALEPGTLLTAQLVLRHGTTVRLDAVDVQAAHPGLREDLTLISRALYCLELCRELTRPEEPHPGLFDALEAYLQRLERREAGPTSLIAFELGALAEAGLMPRFDRCALCGGPPTDAPVFDPAHGGVVCPGCQRRAPGALPIIPSLAAALAGLQAGARTPLEAPMRARAWALLNAFISHQLGRRLRSVDFLTQVGLD